MSKVYHCVVSGEIIPETRVEFLVESGIPEEQWTTVKNSQVRKKKAFFLQPNDLGEGEVDSSNLVIVNHLYNDTVRGILKGEGNDEESGSDDEGNDSKSID
jgi:hypothetical protein